MVNWKRSLRTKTPEEGYQLAIKLSQESIKQIQPNKNIREKIRPKYSKDADSLIAASQVVATHFQTVAAANNYWHSRDGNNRSSIKLNM